MLFEEGPPKMRLDDILKRAHSLDEDSSIKYSMLTNSQLKSTSKKMEKYEAKQTGKQSTKTASESDQAESKTDIPNEDSTTAVSTVTDKEDASDFVSAVKMLARETSKSNPTTGTPANNGPARAPTQANTGSVRCYGQQGILHPGNH
jgi:hypothetical protein